MSIFKPKKNKMGMPAAPRARAEITKEYELNAFQAGRKRRLIVDLEQRAGRLEEEIEEHIRLMGKLDLEYQAVPAEAAAAVPDAPAVAAPAIASDASA